MKMLQDFNFFPIQCIVKISSRREKKSPVKTALNIYTSSQINLNSHRPFFMDYWDNFRFEFATLKKCAFKGNELGLEWSKTN